MSKMKYAAIELANGRTVIVCDDDQFIQAMLVRQCVMMPGPPVPPNDVVMAAVSDSGVRWMVLRFFKPGDEGFVAYGLPEESIMEVKECMFGLLLGSLSLGAASRGIDAWKHATITEQGPPETN